MPWEIVRDHQSCPKSKSWAVVKSKDGELEGCHRSRVGAQRQLAALNVAEEGRMQMSDKELRTLDLPLKETRAKVQDGRTLVGYAAVFNRPVEIDSLQGHFVETILPGAFKKSLRERGDQIKVLFNHGLDTLGKMPLGKPTVLQEDDRGLYVEVPLSRTDFNDNRILPLIRDGALHGMSIQFEAMQQEWSQDRMERRLKEVALHELGPVTFPAQELATMEIRSQEQREREAAQRHLQAESSTEEGRDTGRHTEEGRDTSRHTKFLDRLTRMRKMDLEYKELETRIDKL